MKMQTRIMGIDPGTRYTGIGIIDRIDNRLKYVFSETIITADITRLEDKLLTIFKHLKNAIEQYAPQKAAVERIFHSVNARSSLLLGHARGVALLVLKMNDVDLFEFAPNEVKSAVVGVGRATKEQVNEMVKILLNLNRSLNIREDETDALAAAICLANSMDFAAFEKQPVRTNTDMECG